MTARVFVDTNVLVYQLDERDPAKQERARAWLDFIWTSRTGRVSFQVLSELYVTVTRKLEPGLDPEAARTVVKALGAWDPVPVNERVFAAAWIAQDRYRLSWWDALIVGAARLADCGVLLSEDLQHGQDLDGLRVINPFLVSPQELTEPHTGG
jgi:predicted nucleic acid-binding protein